MLNAGLFSSVTPEWYTPRALLKDISAFLGGDFYDPCPARVSHPDAPDGLTLDWSQYPAIFLNPPYGREISRWTAKALSYGQQEIILLVPARTDTKWFQPFFVYPLCFIAGRLTFEGGNGKVNNAPFPSCLIYQGRHITAFGRHFSPWGAIIAPLRIQAGGAERGTETSIEGGRS